MYNDDDDFKATKKTQQRQQQQRHHNSRYTNLPISSGFLTLNSGPNQQ